jgi:D-alanyl-lipoteichoic acid acyltransferase DltB (MBOAT superfamily)
MIYSSYEFLLFLPPVIVWFYLLPSLRAQTNFLLATSCVFLAWTGIWNLLPAAITIALVWVWYSIEARWPRFGSRTASLVVTLLVVQLACLKYRSFVADTLHVALPTPGPFAYFVPLGISFYTFEAISAVLDLRRRPYRLTLANWGMFILFMPHLIAGPIVRLRQLLPQIEQKKTLLGRNVTSGFHLFVIGFVKKIAADPLGQIVDPFWAAPSQASSGALLLALIGFSAQLYLDFSGYTDMGRGVARMLGFRLPINFRAPFFAHTPSEFYQRWHVSLSSWIRVFVYDTLAVAVFRRVRGRRRQNRALFLVILLVMAIFGLWHGSAWHYVLFGVAQGFVIAGWAAVTKGKAPRTRAKWITSLVCLQVSWLFSLVLFRAADLTTAGHFLVGLITGGTWFDRRLLWCVAAMLAALAFQSFEYFVRRRGVARTLCWLRTSVPGAALLTICFALTLWFKVSLDANAIAQTGASAPAQSFIYFRF